MYDKFIWQYYDIYVAFYEMLSEENYTAYIKLDMNCRLRVAIESLN